MSNTTEKKSPSVEAFLNETIAMAKQLGNIRVNELRKAIAKSKGYATVKSYLDKLEAQDAVEAHLRNNIDLPDAPIYLGKFFLPSWLAEHLASDEDSDEYEDELCEIYFEEWLSKISGLSHSVRFTIVKNYGRNSKYLYDEGYTTFCKPTDTICEVIATGSHSTMDAIKADYALRPELFEKRYHAFLNTLLSNETSPIGMFTAQQWKREQDKFRELGDSFNMESFIDIIENDMALTALYFSTTV